MFSEHFNISATVINISIAIFLAIYAIRKKSASSIFLSLFLYITFHYTYSVLFIFSPFFDPSEYGDLHYQTFNGVKAVGFGFLFFILAMLFIRYRKHIFYRNDYMAEKYLKTIFLLWLAMVFSNWTVEWIKGAFPTKIVLQDFFSCFLMVILTWSFKVALYDQKDHYNSFQKNVGRVLLAVLILMVAVGTCELLLLRTWSLVDIDSQEYVRRANSLLFNPNVLGFWCAFVAIFASFIFHFKMCSKKISALMLVLAGYGILLSGSRSGLIICLLLLGLASILLFAIKKRNSETAAFTPLLIFVAGMGIISFILKGLDKITNSTLKGLRAMALLVERFIDIPKQIAGYVITSLTGVDIFQNNSGLEYSFNIEARLTTTANLPDNGYLAMLKEDGWPAMITWIILWILLAVIGIQALRKAPGIRSAYSLSLVVGCALSAMFVRAFQVFPFWVIISLCLSLCLAWFSVVFRKEETSND